MLRGPTSFPGMVVFEAHNANKIVWVLGWRPKHRYHCTLLASKGVFGYLGWWYLNCTVQKLIVWVLGWLTLSRAIDLGSNGSSG